MVSDDTHFRVYRPGEMLIRQGSSDQSLFIILAGTVSITEGTGETIFAVLRAGDIFGEMAFLTDTRRTANVVARDAVIALKLDRVRFEQLSARIREKFKDKIIEKLVARLDTANKELVRINAAVSDRFPEPSKPIGSPPGRPAADATEPAFISGRELIRKIVSDTASLPAMPEVMLKVQQMIKHPGTSPAQLSKIIETDPAMVTGILKVANSAYYGFRGKVSTIQHASSLFGTRRLAELITAMSAGGVLGMAMGGYGLKAGDMWRHSIAVACTAGEIASSVSAEAYDSAYMAGLLHDVGKIILDPFVQERSVLFDHYFAAHPDKPLQDAERDILGFDHAVIAGILCDNWNLPRSISFGIRHHHQPSSAGGHQLSHIVHLADYISVQAGLGAGGKAACHVLDETSSAAVSLGSNFLQTAADKAHHYVESLTGRLLGS
ncbi:HDOD domain-containing protein [Desulfosarcina alkanivorans]|nr:HDOD domain-containing protein [Desulfosarcina alkanivorans]